MDYSEWPIEDKAMFAIFNPAAAQRLAKGEALTLSIAAVLGAPFAATVAIVKVLCAEFSLTPEALRVKLARGDSDVWDVAERLKAMWNADAKREAL